jgi:hypothetical protein
MKETQPSGAGSLLLSLMQHLEAQILEAAGRLPHVGPDELEQLAIRMSEALAAPPPDGSSPLGRVELAKGRAIVALFAKAAEFRRAASKYAEAAIEQILAAEAEKAK